MKKVDEALSILKRLSLPRRQQNLRSALTLLALAGIGKRSRWANTTRPLLRTVDIMDWMSQKFGKTYKPNSRETVRRQTLHQFEQARLVDRNPDNPTNNFTGQLYGPPIFLLTFTSGMAILGAGDAGSSLGCLEFVRHAGDGSSELASIFNRLRPIFNRLRRCRNAQNSTKTVAGSC